MQILCDKGHANDIRNVFSRESDGSVLGPKQILNQSNQTNFIQTSTGIALCWGDVVTEVTPSPAIKVHAG